MKHSQCWQCVVFPAPWSVLRAHQVKAQNLELSWVSRNTFDSPTTPQGKWNSSASVCVRHNIQCQVQTLTEVLCNDNHKQNMWFIIARDAPDKTYMQTPSRWLHCNRNSETTQRHCKTYTSSHHCFSPFLMRWKVKCPELYLCVQLKCDAILRLTLFFQTVTMYTDEKDPGSHPTCNRGTSIESSLTFGHSFLTKFICKFNGLCQHLINW